MKDLKDIKLHEVLNDKEFNLAEIKDMIENLRVSDSEFIKTIKILKDISKDINEPVTYDLAGNYSLLISDSRIHVIQYVHSFYMDEFEKQLT